MDRTASFRWRHRMLALPASENDTELENIVEADETYLLEFFKGQRELPRQADIVADAPKNAACLSSKSQCWSSRIGRHALGCCPS